LLIFPEGTCVNNEYCVQFKKGTFDVGATIVPVAIKYKYANCDIFSGTILMVVSVVKSLRTRSGIRGRSRLHGTCCA